MNRKVYRRPSTKREVRWGVVDLQAQKEQIQDEKDEALDELDGFFDRLLGIESSEAERFVGSLNPMWIFDRHP